ncbi:MAG: hypothetical protein M1835_001698 [Candelina submexicana]|nr:MAG: hypothetical protein M1835_001698 [Candelina submexicana]
MSSRPSKQASTSHRSGGAGTYQGVRREDGTISSSKLAAPSQHASSSSRHPAGSEVGRSSSRATERPDRSTRRAPPTAMSNSPWGRAEAAGTHASSRPSTAIRESSSGESRTARPPSSRHPSRPSTAGMNDGAMVPYRSGSTRQSSRATGANEKGMVPYAAAQSRAGTPSRGGDMVPYNQDGGRVTQMAQQQKYHDMDIDDLARRMQGLEMQRGQQGGDSEKLRQANAEIDRLQARIDHIELTRNLGYDPKRFRLADGQEGTSWRK